MDEGRNGEIRNKCWDALVAGSGDENVRVAGRVLADRTTFKLDEPDWRRFMELIDRPAVVPKGLRSLFSKPSVFE